MRDLMIVKWCDVCFQESNSNAEPGLKLEATSTFALSIAEGETKRPSLHVLDVCDVHAKLFVDLLALVTELPFAEKVQAANATVAQLPPSKRPSPSSTSHEMIPCMVCRRQIMRNTIVAHIWKMHRSDPQPKAPSGKCPDCGDYKGSSQALAQHRRHMHGFDAMLDALSGVEGYVITGNERDFK